MQEAQAPKLDRSSDADIVRLTNARIIVIIIIISNTAAGLANLCTSVHYYGKLNLMLPLASKSQKITFILMKCTKTVATRAAPFGPDMHQIVCRLGLRPRPHWGAYSAPPDPIAGLRVRPPGKGKREGREREGRG